jgi:hypothetical protein
MDELPLSELFDEELYLHTFPDIALAVRDGKFPSGYEHWAGHGRVELAYSQRVGGSTFLLAAIGHGAEGSGASDDVAREDLASDDPLNNLAVGGTSPVAAESDSLQKQHV